MSRHPTHPQLLPATFGALLIAALLTLPARAESPSLVWDSRIVSANTTNAVEEVALDYGFVNKGSQSVQIRGVRTGCDCTVAEPDRHSLAPGERGTLHIRFKVGFRTGKQERTLLVETDDSPNSPTELQLRLDILELLPLKPRLLFWDRTEEAREKAITLELALPEKTQVSGVESSEKDYTVRLERTKDKGRLLLWVKPGSTNGYSQARILVHYTHEGKELEAHAFAAVR